MNTAAAPTKFTFDLDLARNAEKSRLVGESKLEQMLAEAEQRGYERGLEEGQQTALAASADKTAKAAEKLANRTSEVARSADQAQKQLLTEAAQLAVGTARKLAAHLIARMPMAGIAELMDECLSSLGSVPHLVIRCHPDLADAVKQLAEEKMRISGFDGRLVVMGEPEIMLGDARLEWVDGGLVRDLNRINGEIDQRLADYIKANGAPRAGENEQ